MSCDIAEKFGRPRVADPRGSGYVAVVDERIGAGLCKAASISTQTMHQMAYSAGDKAVSASLLIDRYQYPHKFGYFAAASLADDITAIMFDSKSKVVHAYHDLRYRLGDMSILLVRSTASGKKMYAVCAGSVVDLSSCEIGFISSDAGRSLIAFPVCTETYPALVAQWGVHDILASV